MTMKPYHIAYTDQRYDVIGRELTVGQRSRCALVSFMDAAVGFNVKATDDGQFTCQVLQDLHTLEDAPGWSVYLLNYN